MLSEDFIKKQEARLKEELAKVEEKIAFITRKETPEDNSHWDETANDAIQDVEEESLLRIYRNLKDRVEAALGRIENGTYGKCLDSGRDIPEKVLLAEPWADSCPN